MRRVLIDIARAKKYQKRGGDAVRVTRVDGIGPTTERGHDLLALDDATRRWNRIIGGRGQFTVGPEGLRTLIG